MSAALISLLVISFAMLPAGVHRGFAVAAPSEAVRVRAAVRCEDARFVAGMNIPDARDLASGDIRTVDAILDAAGAHVGYRYTLHDGRAYVSDRARDRLTLEGLARMNDLVNTMSAFRYNAFDPRDNGFTVYRVAWQAATARKLHVTTRSCPP